eukprot:gene36068-43739_t
MGEVSAESAKDFLAHYGVTEDKVDNASWQEWIEAIDKATSGNSDIPESDVTGRVSETSTLPREGSEADFHQLSGLAPLKVPSASSVSSTPSQSNSASGYWGNNKTLFPEQDHNASVVGTMDSHTIHEETEENVTAELQEEEEVHPYHTEEEIQGPPPDIQRIDLSSEFQEPEPGESAQPAVTNNKEGEVEAEKSPTAFSERQESAEETAQTPLLNSPAGYTQELSPSQQTDAGSTTALLASEEDTHNPMLSDPDSSSVASSSSPKTPPTTQTVQLASPVGERMDRGAPDIAPASRATNDKRETPARKSSCFCC